MALSLRRRYRRRPRVHARHARSGRRSDRVSPVALEAPAERRGSTGPDAAALRTLAAQLIRYAPHDGRFPLRLPGTYAMRGTRVTSEPVHAALGPALCLIAQGAKVMMLGSDVLEYDAARMLIFAVDLPVSGQVTRASRAEPYLGFRLDLIPARVAQLAARVYPHGVPKAADSRGLYVGQATDGITEAVSRLLDLMARADEAELLGPLVIDEIVLRLLRTPIGPRVAQIGMPKSGVHRVAQAIAWIRAHFSQPITVDDMAGAAQMSASSFHQRFKAVTTLSPLQYQKTLRLQEARRLMLFRQMDANEACHRVGYLSASQFSREYARFFGRPPLKDVARLRDEGFGPPVDQA